MRIGVVVGVVVGLGSSSRSPASRAADSAVERGKRAYAANCTACHNPDPTKDGTVGPAIAGSSLELVRARVLKAEYPPGYTPKRDSHLMPAQPFLAADVPDLAAYLGSFGRGGRGRVARVARLRAAAQEELQRGVLGPSGRHRLHVVARELGLRRHVALARGDVRVR